MTSWLSKQKKQTLLDLSSEAGLKQEDDTRKDELVENLDEYLQKNATRLSRNPAFETYFGTRRTPFKARSSSAAAVTSDDGEVKSVVKARGRRTTKVKQEDNEEEGGTSSPSQAVVPASNASTTKTPGRPRRRSELLPPSPADVAEDMEYAATRMYAGINDLYSGSSLPERIDSLRELCSSVTGVQLSILFLEACGLQRQLLPWQIVYIIPSYLLFGFSTPHMPIYLPNLFALLDPGFWSTSLLWAATSIAIPLLFGYFYNLSVRDVKRHGERVTVTRYQADPLAFHVVKALATIIVYQNEYTLFGLINPSVVESVDSAMFGGYKGMLAGSYVGIIAALYEAAQRK